MIDKDTFCGLYTNFGGFYLTLNNKCWCCAPKFSINGKIWGLYHQILWTLLPSYRIITTHFGSIKPVTIYVIVPNLKMLIIWDLGAQQQLFESLYQIWGILVNFGEDLVS